jgi:hypothetical protein
MLAERSSVTKKFRERKALALRIKCTSFEMFPCSGCEKNNTKYVVSDKENSGRCSECVLCKARCNVKGILVGKWQSLKAKEGRLEREREAALLFAKQSISCARRLEKQMKFLKSKGKDIVRCGLKTMDKLDEAEEKEKQIESEQAATAAMLSNSPIPCAPAPGVETDPFIGLKVLLLPPKVWAN